MSTVDASIPSDPFVAANNDMSLLPLGQILLKRNYIQQRDLEKALVKMLSDAARRNFA